MNLTILGFTNCQISFGQYSNKTIAISVTREGEPIAKATVNWEANWKYGNYGKRFSFPCVVIKDYSENEGIFKNLVEQGVVSNGAAYMEGTGGKVIVTHLTNEYMEICKQQLKL